MDFTSIITSSTFYSTLTALGVDPASLAGIDTTNMDIEDVSVPDSPLETGESSPDVSAMDRQLATLRTYLNHLPYECETVEQMHEQLEYIVGMITTCAKAKSWLFLTTWDGALQWYVAVF